MKDLAGSSQGEGSCREMQLHSPQPRIAWPAASGAEKSHERSGGEKRCAEEGRGGMKWKGQGGVRKEEKKQGEKEEFPRVSHIPKTK